ncbi:MAG: hypothetical protein CBE00_10845 [Planctomycetaceae bacterium TMED240]|nr:hypothetical protein [Rhodopirellula sp.]OUX05330.1 MAG: hypothetical protein CBE00_10845 [Planctomycetaceae bacterium TMED240]
MPVVTSNQISGVFFTNRSKKNRLKTIKVPSFTIEKHFWQSPKSATNQPLCLVVKMTAKRGYSPKNTL